jgi:hypothetical protein
MNVNNFVSPAIALDWHPKAGQRLSAILARANQENS